MRCDNCSYCSIDSWDDSDWICGIFGRVSDEITEDRNGNYGCKYNEKTLAKKQRELDNWWNEQQIKQAEEIELRKSLKSVPKGIIKLEDTDKIDLLDYFMTL